MKVPTTRYVELHERQVAWQAHGTGPDMVLLTGLSGHLDLQWEIPEAAQFLARLGGFCRVIQFMPPGLGLSDPAPPGATPYDWDAEFLAVTKAAEAERVFVYADREAGPAAIRFADRHPGRVAGLVLANTSARVNRDRDYPEGADPAMFAALEQFLLGAWGTPEMARLSMPSHDNDPNFLEASARLMRATCTPRTATRWFRELAALDVRPEARRLACPVLLLKRREFPFGSPEAMGWLAAHIPSARLIEIAGADIMFSHDRASEALGHIQEFLTGGRAVNVADRRFQVLMFLDIVKSTQTAVQIGDTAWRELLERFHAIVNGQIARFGGRTVDSAGDGNFCVFQQPGPALACALAVREQASSQGLTLRVGLHAGECELGSGGEVRGLAVHIAARVLGMAEAGTVFVSETFRQIVIGGAQTFTGRGLHRLKGVPGVWKLYELDA